MDRSFELSSKLFRRFDFTYSNLLIRQFHMSDSAQNVMQLMKMHGELMKNLPEKC